MWSAFGGCALAGIETLWSLIVHWHERRIMERHVTAYDMINRKTIERSPGGTYGQISLDRLEEMFRMTGEVYTGERVTHFEIREDVLVFRVDK